MQTKQQWGRLVPVTGGLALALIMIASAVAQATGYTQCQQCRDYYNWWAANHTMPQGGCQDYPSKNQSDNKGTCIQNYTNSKCKSICDASPVEVGTVACAGEEGIKEICRAATGEKGDDASGPCNQSSWGATCDGSDANKRCYLKQVNKEKVPLPSVCYVNCECGIP
jgi:hypothetical protein